MRPNFDLPRVYLNPGDLHVTSQPTLIETVLGSCVAVTLYCPVSHKAAMCHAMLPTGQAGAFRFVDAALLHMIERLRSQGVQPSRLVAKLFGGADMFSQLRNAAPSRFPVGENNIKRAVEILREHRIEVKSQDTSGERGRKLLFFTDTGQVYVKLLNRQAEGVVLDMPFLNEVGDG